MVDRIWRPQDSFPSVLLRRPCADCYYHLGTPGTSKLSTIPFRILKKSHTCASHRSHTASSVWPRFCLWERLISCSTSPDVVTLTHYMSPLCPAQVHARGDFIMNKINIPCPSWALFLSFYQFSPICYYPRVTNTTWIQLASQKNSPNFAPTCFQTHLNACPWESPHIFRTVSWHEEVSGFHETCFELVSVLIFMGFPADFNPGTIKVNPQLRWIFMDRGLISMALRTSGKHFS